MLPEENRWDGSRDCIVLQTFLHSKRWKPTPDLSMTKRAEPLPALQQERSWNNKACARSDTIHKENAGKHSQAKGHNVRAYGPSQFRWLLSVIWI